MHSKIIAGLKSWKFVQIIMFKLYEKHDVVKSVSNKLVSISVQQMIEDGKANEYFI